MSIAVGDKAPSFSLADQNGATVSLADLAGSWVVLYFYPKDDTPGCTTEACEFSESITSFRDLDATVLGCSADSVASHAKFAAKYGDGNKAENFFFGDHSLSTQRAADLEKEIAHNYADPKADPPTRGGGGS